MRTGLIYKARINNKNYIGCTVDFVARKADHLRAKSDSYFHKTIRKYGAETVTWRVLVEWYTRKATSHSRTILDSVL